MQNSGLTVTTANGMPRAAGGDRRDTERERNTMQSRTHVAALALAVILAGPGLALAQQEVTPPEGGATAEQNSAADPAAAPADAATDGAAEAEAVAPPQNGAAQAGETYVAEVSGAWQRRCVRVEEGAEPCQLYQVLEDSNGGPVAEIVIFPLPDGQEAAAGAIITTPLETLLTEDVTIAVDGTDGRRYPFSFCTEQGCVSRIGLTAEDIAAFKRGSTARVRIVPARAPDQQVILSASLSGFTAGFDALAAVASE